MKKRIIAVLLCALTLLGLIPTAALAAPSTVTVESETNSAFDYLQYYSDGTWKDLNTPKHTIEQTGEIAYCVEHTEGNPHGETYTATTPTSVFDSTTVAGLQTILMFGYPCNTPSGFSADEARQATANAIRFWLAERGEEGSYNFTNRKTNPDGIRAKSGYEHVLSFADELLAKARAHQTLTHAITFSPTAATLTPNGSSFVGQTTITLTNINSGYTLSGVPDAVSVSGYTGSKSETITLSAPASQAGKSFTVKATGKDTRSLDNITAYVPASGSYQKIFLCATTAQIVATATFNASVPAFGKLKIMKTGENGAALAGVTFGVYSDSACKNKIAELTTGADGSVISGDMSVGTVYVKELSTIKPYVLSTVVTSSTITADNTVTVKLTNKAVTGKIQIEKKGEQLVGVTESKTEYGKLYTPKFEVKGLKGVTYEVKNSAGTVVAAIVTDASGIAATAELPLGSYTVSEKSTVAGYILDTTVHTVTLAYKDQKTAIVTEKVAATNVRQNASLSFKKLSQFFNMDSLKFESCNGEGFVFGLYTAEAIGVIPNGAMVDILTTNANGEAKTNVSLPLGKYCLKELAVPDPTIIMNDVTYPLTISGSGAAVINTQYYEEPIVNDMFKANIAIIKSDENDESRMLKGAEYEVRDSSGKLYCTMVTDEKGYAKSIDLPVGKYFIKETVPPVGFVLSDEIIEVTLTTNDKKTAVFERTNKPNELILEKTDSVTGNPVEDTLIRVNNANGEQYCEGYTNKDGELIIHEIPAGQYTFEEIAAAEGYSISTETYSFKMDDHGSVKGTATFANDPITLKIDKTDTYTGKPFAGIEFTLKDSEGMAVKTKLTEVGYRIVAEDGTETFAVDDKGCAEFRYLPTGKYTLAESTPIGYIAEDSIEFELTDNDSLSKPKELHITNCPTGLKILKTDSKNGTALKNVGFRLKVKGSAGFEDLTFIKQKDGSYFYSESGDVLDLLTNENGVVTVYGLPLGVVWIEESIVPEGYFPISAVKVEITKETSFDKPLEVKITNSKFVKLGLNSDWWEFPAFMLGIALLGGGTAFFLIRRRKLKKEA